MNDKQDTKSRVLDAAEKLFGLKGFEATSLRDITAEAQVNLAAVNYHFQSKDSLIDAVIARRIEPVNHRRLKMLEAAGPNLSLEQILTAFLAPILDLKEETVIPLMGRILTQSSQFFLDRVYRKHFEHVARRFHEELSKVLPNLPADERWWRLYFAAGVMTHILSWSHVLSEMSGGLCDVTDRRAVVDRAVSFLAAGFRAAASEPRPELVESEA